MEKAQKMKTYANCHKAAKVSETDHRETARARRGGRKCGFPIDIKKKIW